MATCKLIYNGNGGFPSQLQRTYNIGESIVISGGTPSYDNRTFYGWSTVAYSKTPMYQNGDSLMMTGDITLYAVWTPNEYTIYYDMGDIEPATAVPAQTKQYGVPLRITPMIPVKTGYEFVGWVIEKNDTSIIYKPNDLYDIDGKDTLYAIWRELTNNPIVSNCSVVRCDADKAPNDFGTNVLLKFSYQFLNDYIGTLVYPIEVICYKKGTQTSLANTKWSRTVLSDSGKLEWNTDAAFDYESEYYFVINATDSFGLSTSVKVPLNSSRCIRDYLGGEERGVAFGKTATVGNTAEFEFDVKANNAVYGTAMGLAGLPSLNQNDDLNSYTMPGSYAIPTIEIAETLNNSPVQVAGRFEIWSANGAYPVDGQYDYIRQRYIPDSIYDPVYVRDVYMNANRTGYYYDNWVVDNTYQQVLWQGSLVMGANDIVRLESNVSTQRNGIVLIFSKQNKQTGVPDDANFNSFFVPKTFIRTKSGSGYSFLMGDVIFSKICSKYLYIENNKIRGNASNNATGVGATGITYDNAVYVLRFVYGV